MEFNRYCILSGEDFTAIKHNYVTAGKKIYLNDMVDLSSKYNPPDHLIRRLVGISGSYSLVSVMIENEDSVYNFCVLYFIFFRRF
jgi:hypothetical protein